MPTVAGEPTELAQLTDAVRAAPPGPSTVAVVDESALLDGSAAAVLAGRRLRAGATPVADLPAELPLVAGAGGDGGEPALRRLVASWAGRPVEDLDAEARRVLVSELGALLRPEMWALVAEHHRAGHRVVVTGSGTRFHLGPLAADLGADAVVVTGVADRDGTLTGGLDGPVLRGPAKARAVLARLDELGADPAGAFGYAGGADDVALLEALGRPVVVGSAGSAVARERGWPVLACASRGGALPSVGDVLRTVGFYAGLTGALGTATGVGLLRRSRRRLLDLACGVGGDVGLALAGIDVEVTGAEHLWSARPCVFVFNHQSKLDVVLLMKLLRAGFTGVAKAEAKAIPGWGQLFQLAEVAFVDRGNAAQARDALAPAVAKVRDEGWSLAIAPEGTRSPTPRLGRFKKGAFHIAMQAGVPMVPIVIHDAGAVMWRGAQTLRSGTVHVRVLPPVDTSGWTVATLSDHVDDVRSRMAAAL